MRSDIEKPIAGDGGYYCGGFDCGGNGGRGVCGGRCGEPRMTWLKAVRLTIAAAVGAVVVVTAAVASRGRSGVCTG